MEVAIPEAAIEWVAGLFDRRVLARGLAYAQEGRVQLVRGEWPVVAKVRGTQGYVVTVHYTPENHHARGDCSCPVGFDCKHAAAAALVAMANRSELADARYRALKERAVGDWLARVGVVTEPDAAPVREVICYVLSPGSEATVLEVHRCRAKKRGGYGRSSVLRSPSDPHRGVPSWIDTDDLRRITMLRALARADDYDVELTIDRIDSALWRDLADTGRLFWREVGTTPLAFGTERSVRLAWQPGEDDPTEFTLRADQDLIILAANQCHYVDLHSSTVGPLDLGVPAGIAQQLITSPPVPATMLATVERSLSPLLGDAALSLAVPERAGAGAEEMATMRPQVSIDLDTFDGQREVSLRADARYGDRTFELAVWDPDRPAARDMVAESQRLARLERLRDGYYQRDHERGALGVLAELRYLVEQVLPVLAEEGWDCHVAADLPVEPVVTDAEWIETLQPVSAQSDWFSFELGVVVAGRTVPLLPILLAAIKKGEVPLDPALLEADHIPGLNLRLPDGALVHVSGQRMKRWLRPLLELELRGVDEHGALIVPSFAAADFEDHSAGPFAQRELLDQARQRLIQLVDLPPRSEPASFAGTLRSYQRQGLAWLRFLYDAGYGGLLADDMGLGKTVQVLALLEELRAAGEVISGRPALVVAPRSVVGHWKREAERFCAGLEPRVHLGADRARTAELIARAPLVVTSYQTMARDIDQLATIDWSVVVFDEAQAVKNPSTRVRKAAARLRATSRFAITGTPIENHLRELWSQMDLVMHGLLGRRQTFETFFRRPIEKFGIGRSLELLRQRIRPFLLRRTKSTVEIDLPAKTEIVEMVELGPAQRDLYESLRLSLDADVRRALEHRGVQGAQLVVLDALLKLRQCCCDPRLIKTAQAREIESSAKLSRLMTMLDELADSGRSVLVFSQFTSMLDIIAASCRDADIGYLELTGKTRDREAIVDAFQAGQSPVLLISLKAGGVGLNLTRADTVIHYDPWWNPAVEDQATDRAHRIGQDKNVFVYKLVARGTLEERIAELQSSKRALTTAALERGGVSHLSADDLGALYHQLV